MRCGDGGGLQCGLKKGGSRSWAPGLEPSEALGEGTPSLHLLLPPQGRKAAGPSSSSLLTPSVDTLCAAWPFSGLTE